MRLETTKWALNFLQNSAILKYLSKTLRAEVIWWTPNLMNCHAGLSRSQLSNQWSLESSLTLSQRRSDKIQVPALTCTTSWWRTKWTHWASNFANATRWILLALAILVSDTKSKLKRTSYLRTWTTEWFLSKTKTSWTSDTHFKRR